MAEMITVRIVDAKGNSMSSQPLKFDPPEQCAVIIQELVEGGRGAGHLLSADGVTVTRNKQVSAGDYTYHVTAAAQPPQPPAGMAEMAENIISIKRLITASSEATRHASTIKDHDLDAVEAALNICFVPVMPDNLDSAAKATLEDNQEFKWEDNGHEAKRRDDYLNIMASKVKLPSHLTWSHHRDRHDILKASMHAGGATLPFSIGCRTDAMETVGRAQMPLEAAIVATVEMKKKVVRQSLRQTKATYICASLKSQLPVISCVTDMGAAAVAYYTSGQKREDGVTIIVEHIFSSVDDMLEFLGTALGAQSVSANVLRWRNASQTDLDMPGELPNPKRVRLPVPKHAQLDKIQPLTNLANLLCLDDDVARMADVEGVFPDSDMPFYIS